MPTITLAGYALVALTGIMALILGALIVSLFRLGRATSGAREVRTENAMMSAALQEAVTKLRTQERVTAARAEASERLAGQIVVGLTAGLIVSDHRSRVQIVNPAARRFLRLDDAAWGIGESLHAPERDVTVREMLRDAAPLADVIDEVQRTGIGVARRTVTLRGGPAPLHFGVSVSRIAGASTGESSTVCLFTDLTSVVELEEQLRLKEALARLGELTAGLAHEFRNGLATIHGYGRLLDPEKLPPGQRPYLEGIREETTALGEVVTNFLNFAKPNPLTLARVDLRGVVDRAVDDIASSGVRVAVTGTFGTIEGDEVLLRQAFSNLLRNAIEACVGAGRTPDISIAGIAEDDVVRVSVDDNGPGIEPPALAKLFQPFATTKSEGTGLGLAIVQKVIVSHNGRITAGNRPEGGAQFRIQLPLSR